MFFNIFIIMDKKIKKLVIDNIFDGVDIDFDAEVVMEEYGGNTLKFIVYVDSYKLYKSSGYFNEEYYFLITDLADGNLDEEIAEFLPMIGYGFDYFELGFDKTNLDGYRNLFYTLDELGYQYKIIDRYNSSAWLFIEFNMSGSEVNRLYEQLEEVISVEDIVLLAK